MIYRHIHDDSVLYEVRGAQPRHDLQSDSYVDQYEVRRVDNPEVFDSEAFVVDAAEFEQIYEPEENNV